MAESRIGNLIHEESHPAGKLCSSYTVECIAMLRALPEEPIKKLYIVLKLL